LPHPDPFPQNTASGEDAWPAELTRRLRVLLHTLPLDGIRRGDAMRDPELRHYDGLALALRILDVVVDRLGMETEADREVVTRVLRPVLAAADRAHGVDVSPARHDAIIDRLLGALRNDGEARRPFRETYTAVDDDGSATRHALEFRLLYDAFHPSGGTVLRPSSEACNLYLRLLDLDIEDAQAAAEAVVESQMARGRFDEAAQTARQARIQSVRFKEKVLRVLRDTRRDVDRVDWRDEVPRMLDDALAHLGRRLTVERGILAVADDHLDVLTDEDEGHAAVAAVAHLVRDCLLRHAELHEELIGARNVFLDAQARQAFAPGPSRPLPDLAADVLAPLLTLPVRQAEEITEAGMPLLLGPAAPPLLSLARTAAWMLRPRRPRPAVEVMVDPVDAADLEEELRRYPPEIRAAASTILEEAAPGTRLSGLLATARADDHPDEVLEVIVLLTLQAFSSEDTGTPTAVERADDAPLDDSLFYGDDLLLTGASTR